VEEIIPISGIDKIPTNSRVKIIGMVTEKRELKSKLFLKLEDFGASITVLVPQTLGHQTMVKARSLLLDQVICVNAVKGSNDFLIAKDVIWPDIPQRSPNTATIPVYAALISDLHIGSTLFMQKAFDRFIHWLNGKFGNEALRNIAHHIKYIVIAGDLVDGIGIYPNQIKELEITDIKAQYDAVYKYLEKIPEHIEIIVTPGNHDAARKALPQPAIPQQYAESLYKSRRIHSFGNPCTLSLHGVNFLLYHGRSLDDTAAVVPNTSFQTPEKTMKTLLQSRHLAPIYGEKTPIAPEKKDFMVIENVPDVFHAGHVHVYKSSTYRGSLLINSGAWQTQTEFQRKMGITPTPGIAPVVNLQTLSVIPINFGSN
jgi:DNA polymerase II small subunit